MNEKDNIQTIQGIYEAFGRGDVGFILNTLTQDVGWNTRLESVVPWSGDFSGREHVPQFFDAIFKSVDVLAFTPQEWFAQGDTVVSVGEFGCRIRATGKEAHTRWVFLWRLRDGKVSSYEQFHDPALAEAFR